MNYTQFYVDVENISNLSDLPNEEEGLSSAELKATFDKAGSDIKNFLNNSLIPELNATIRAFPVTFPKNVTEYTKPDYLNVYHITPYTHVICSIPADASYFPPAMIYAYEVHYDGSGIAFRTEVAPTQDVNLNVLLIG